MAPTDLQNFPVLTAAAGGVQGTLNSAPNATFRIEFFGNTACDASGNGEGATFLGTIDVATDGAGNATIPPFTAAAGQFVTATATDPANNTSEFSACVLTAETPVITVVATDAEAAELGPNTATFVVSRTGPTTAVLDVPITVGGTATLGTDYLLTSNEPLATAGGVEIRIPVGQTSATITVNPVFNPAVESLENITFTIGASVATATIADEPAATIAAPDADAVELGPNTATVVVTRGGASTYDRLVQIVVTGTAALGTDYLLTSNQPLATAGGVEIVIPAGQTSATITVTPIADALTEGAETAVFTAEGSTTTVTIVDVPAPLSLAVTNTADSGAGSLRAAIVAANANTGVTDTIRFDIPGPGPHAIALTSVLPVITDPVIIDGTTEPDFAGVPVVELVGTGIAGGNAHGLRLDAGSSTVRGLVINRFSLAGIQIVTGGANVISGNYIGTDTSGTLARANGTGIIVSGSVGNTIGGTALAQRNVIAGNLSAGINIDGGSGNTVQGNFIGLTQSGTEPLSNGAFGIAVFASTSNMIGGSFGGAGNVVAASTSINISLQGGSNNNTVQGNLIGTNAAGTAVVGANQNGIYLIGSNGNAIGGSLGARNVIAGSAGSGQVVLGTGSTSNLVQGNYIGTDITGTVALPNSTWGIQIGSSGNSIGGTVATGAANVISGNAAGGIALFAAATGNTIHGNRIGTAADGVTALPNQNYGIGILGGSSNTIGLANTPNVIAFNTAAGIAVTAGTQNGLRYNAIFSNGGLGIDLGATGVTGNDAGDGDAGANNLQNFPVLTGAAGGVQGTLNSAPNTTFRIEFFGSAACDASGNGEGAAFLGAVDVSTDATGTRHDSALHCRRRAVCHGDRDRCLEQHVGVLRVRADGCLRFAHLDQQHERLLGRPRQLERRHRASHWRQRAHRPSRVHDRRNGAIGSCRARQSLQSAELLSMTGGSIAVSESSELNGGLLMSGGSLGGAGNLTLGSSSFWTGGNISGPGGLIVQPSAALSVSSPGAPGVLDRTLTNNGFVSWDQPHLDADRRGATHQSPGRGVHGPGQPDDHQRQRRAGGADQRRHAHQVRARRAADPQQPVFRHVGSRGSAGRRSDRRHLG